MVNNPVEIRLKDNLGQIGNVLSHLNIEQIQFNVNIFKTVQVFHAI